MAATYVSQIFLLFTATLLCAVLSLSSDCENYNHLKRSWCIPAGPPKCTNEKEPVSNDFFVECGKRMMNLQKKCGDKEDIIINGYVESIKMVAKVACDKPKVMDSFKSVGACWNETARCVISGLHMPMEYKEQDRNPKTSVCRKAVVDLVSCHQTAKYFCQNPDEVISKFVDKIIKKSKCTACTIKMTIYIVFITLLFTIILS